MSTPHYIISNDLNITLILDGHTHSIGTSHENHGAILEAIREQDWDILPHLIDVAQAIEDYYDGNIVVNEFGEVAYNGQVLHNVITERIRVFREQGLDYARLVKFLNNLMENPSKRAVDELYVFLENKGMAITEDGCFVGYKAVRDDYKDIHSGKFDNTPGAVHEMPRNMVDDDARRACSNGFHVGSQPYANEFGGSNSRIMLVKVNPRDAVSVPHDTGEKLRTCRYEVIEEVERDFIVEEPIYNEDPELDDQWNDFPEDDSWLDEIDEDEENW